MNVDRLADLPDAIREVAHEWPRFDCIDIYDDLDRSVLRVVAGEEVRLH